MRKVKKKKKKSPRKGNKLPKISCKEVTKRRNFPTQFHLLRGAVRGGRTQIADFQLLSKGFVNLKGI